MHGSRLVALAAFSLALVSTAAWAEETAPSTPTAPATGNVVVLKVVKIKGRRSTPQVSIQINRVDPSVVLADLRRPVVDGSAAVARDPF